MKKSLFTKPFNLEKWFVVGFTAFLANLVSGGSSGGSGNSFREKFGYHNINLDEVFTFPDTAYEWLGTHSFWLWFILTGIVVIFAIIIVFTWLSSRGHFMFLYNVVNDKAEVRIPWTEYRKEGNSLFLWRLVFGIIVFFIIITNNNIF